MFILSSSLFAWSCIGCEQNHIQQKNFHEFYMLSLFTTIVSTSQRKMIDPTRCAYVVLNFNILRGNAATHMDDMMQNSIRSGFFSSFFSVNTKHHNMKMSNSDNDNAINEFTCLMDYLNESSIHATYTPSNFHFSIVKWDVIAAYYYYYCHFVSELFFFQMNAHAIIFEQNKTEKLLIRAVGLKWKLWMLKIE